MNISAANPKVVEKMSPREWARLIFIYLLIPILLFLCSGDLGWWQGWVFSVIIFAAGFISRLWAERRHPGLLAERTKFGSSAGVQHWDKVLAPLVAISISFPLVIVAGLDHRFQWSPAFSIWFNLAGFLLTAGGYAFASWALIENRFFSGVVRIQTERGHVVCDTGPYRIVRHPGYLGSILPLFGIALALSSLWTLIPAAAATMIILIRTDLEDRFLQAELPGYREYAQQVRYRLFPGIY